MNVEWIRNILTTKVEIKDKSLEKYINLDTPIKLGGLFANDYFGKEKINLIDRLIGHLMVPGHKGSDHLRTSSTMTGKYNTAFLLLMKAFEYINSKGMNPVETLIRAIENAAPREGITFMLLAGQRLLRQVDLSPVKRLDLVLRWIAQGTYMLSVQKNKKAYITLAEILIEASKKQQGSYLIDKKMELEKQAEASK
ncbi:MAG: 30S ribosomal protein S7 [Candidatus Rehaiarchaeum fermentans]|nr:30S ribosomal protein S7 [Candidatus Rehaiarchaeum fermentans]